MITTTSTFYKVFLHTWNETEWNWTIMYGFLYSWAQHLILDTQQVGEYTSTLDI